ncbi:aminodeoxychorismate lyase [Thermochromatium tepidum]|uniref:Aminodeoxychorismate lyase n=1 Tax=Thermochromatium tepidum ATCC 43061 TaxID=316276 RepID=A0A6I6E2E3_THETI|nr:aminodeoxychorismate lyase [Thermochromatium tepidum]QGU33105.1 aminodeoxychorismate lyase [Thermochromatium tepidum ATCC 43061]
MTTTLETPAPSRILIDGRPGDRLSVLDRALHYGDGLFETIRLAAGAPCQWQRHMDRLILGAERLGIESPETALLAAEAAELIDGQGEGVLKLILSRGDGGRGYAPPPSAPPRRLLLIYPLPPAQGPDWRRGVVVRHCQTPVSINPLLAGIKHLNRLDSVLARAEWKDPAIAEGLMFDANGDLVGGTMTNVFLWDGRCLMTPPVDRSGIAGTVRGLTLELAAHLGIECLVMRLDRAALDQACGLFLTNSIIGVWPVRALEGRRFDLALLPWDLLDRLYQAACTPG